RRSSDLNSMIIGDQNSHKFRHEICLVGSIHWSTLKYTRTLHKSIPPPMELSDKTPQEDVTLLLSYLKAITSLAMHAAEAETLGEVLERIAEASRQLVRARYAALGIPDGKGGLEYFMFAGLDKIEAHAIGRLPQGRGLLGAIMAERQPIPLEHIKDDPRSVGFPPNHPHMDRFLGVPIIVGELLFGMLYLTDRYDGRPFTEQDQWLIEMMASYAALAIAGARLREQR